MVALNWPNLRFLQGEFNQSFTPQGSAALTSVIAAESGGNPASQGYSTLENPGILNPGGAFGIASWNAGRQQDLLDFSNQNGLDPHSLDTQGLFAASEIANNPAYGSSYAALTNPNLSQDQITGTLVSNYERPANFGSEISRAESYGIGPNSGVDMAAPTPTNTEPGFDQPGQPYSLPGGAGGATLAPGSSPGVDNSPYGTLASPDTSSSDYTAAGIGSMSPSDSSGQATDFLGGAYSSKATEGLPGPFGAILGGGQSFNLQSATSDFQGTTPQAQAKTPASTEGQVAQAKATEDEAKSVAKAAETGAKAIGQLAKQQAGTGQQASTTAAQDTKSVVDTEKNIASTTLGDLKDLTQRTFIAFFGLILLAGAVYYFSKGGSPQMGMATA